MTEEELSGLALKMSRVLATNEEWTKLSVAEGIAVLSTIIYLKGIEEGVNSLKKTP